jgi:hypothetical protein
MKIQAVASQAILEGLLTEQQIDSITALLLVKDFDAVDELALTLLIDSLRDGSATIQDEHAKSKVTFMIKVINQLTSQPHILHPLSQAA